MNFHLISIFPDVMKVYTDASVLGRAQKTDKGKGAKHRGKKISVNYYNPRDFGVGKHKKVDDKPYGGGPGMVMAPEPIIKAWQKAVGRKRDQKKVKTIITAARGKQFDQTMAKRLAKNYDHVVIISGRYEGIDSRVQKALNAEYVSVGDYILTGGELPALTMVDAISRHIPGVLGTAESIEEDRGVSGEAYTRPATFTYRGKNFSVPKVFLSGHHERINNWRKGK